MSTVRRWWRARASVGRQVAAKAIFQRLARAMVTKTGVQAPQSQRLDTGERWMRVSRVTMIE